MGELFLYYYFLPLLTTYLLAKSSIWFLRNLKAGKDTTTSAKVTTFTALVWVFSILLSIYLIR